MKLGWLFIVLCLLGSADIAQGQQPNKVPPVGNISGTGSTTGQGPYVEALRQAVRDFGYIDGKDIAIEYRSGGLMSYSTNDIDALRRAATYVAKILKGKT